MQYANYSKEVSVRSPAYSNEPRKPAPWRRGIIPPRFHTGKTVKLQGVPNCGLGSVNMPIDQGCQGYGPIVRYIRPTGDKGRIFYFYF